MFTIFSVPKPFQDGHISMIQENAIKSWLELAVDIEIILCGNDYGIDKFCKKHKIKHIKNIERTENGTPLLNSVFNSVKQQASYETLVYLNTDILLLKSFLDIFNHLPQEDFLIVGQRIDLDINKKIDFVKNWQCDLDKKIKIEGKLHPPDGSDYFVFKKHQYSSLPPFAVGRVGWDNWMLQEARKRGYMLIDASPTTKVIHQNHNYCHKNQQLKGEDDINIRLLGLNHFIPTIRGIKYKLISGGIHKKSVLFKNIKQTAKRVSYGIILFTLKMSRNIFFLLIKIFRLLIRYVNAPLFFIEQNECEKYDDCNLLAKILHQQPSENERQIEYPWLLENIKICSGRMLDVGSTISDMLYEVLPRKIEINSIDLNSKDIKNNNIKFSVGDIRRTGYPNNYFDIISCISTIEHIGVRGRYHSDKDDAGDLKAVKEMFRILKPGGIMLITVPYGIQDILPINRVYNKSRIDKLLQGFPNVEIGYKKYYKNFNLWLKTNESVASQTDIMKESWYALAFIKIKK